MRGLGIVLTVVVLCGCTGRGIDSYLHWYYDQKALVVPFSGGELSIKEVTPEMMFIQTHHGKINSKQLDSFLHNCNIRQVLFELKYSDSISMENLPVFGKHIECVVDKKDALDLIYEHSTQKSKGKKIIAVFDSKEFDSGKTIEFAHPNIEKVFTLSVDKIKINNKRHLAL